MKVICSGMPKTGTKTLASALRTLGYNVYDLEEQFFYLGKDLLKIIEDGWTTDDIRRIFKDVDAVTDIMANLLWEDLLTAFPEAKVIHTERASQEQWSESLHAQIESARKSIFGRLLSNLSPTGRRLRRYFTTSMNLAAFKTEHSVFWFKNLNKQLAMIRYREHNARVRQVVPKDQLLMFNLSDGWTPLCKFLDKPLPNQPFPHKNKGASLTEHIVHRSYVFDAIKKEVLILLTITVAALSLFFYCFLRF